MQDGIKIGVNGAAGRIGKFLTYELVKLGLVVGAVNDLAPIDVLVESYRRKDSTHGTLDWEVLKIDEDCIQINGYKVAVYKEKDPSAIGWSEADVRIVEECTGIFRTKEWAEKYLGGSIKKVIISAPAKGERKEEIATLIMGVNHNTYDPKKHNLISNASCTTKALAVPLKVLIDQGVKIYGCLMDTTHAATSTQRTLDYITTPGALDNIVTTTTGATSATGLVLPELNGLMDGFAYRVPTKDGSFANLFFVADLGALNHSGINAIFEGSVSDPRYMGRLGFIKEGEVEVASCDIVGRTESGIVVGSKTKSLRLPFNGDRIWLVGIVSGYDNERGSAMDQALLTKHIIDKM